MKTFFFFIALSFTSLAFSQGNLQFNQVITLQGAVNNGNVSCGPTLGFTCNSSQIYTVPSGKVWKIESTNCTGNVVNSGGWASYFMSLKINGVDLVGGYSTSNSGFFANDPVKYPIWLSSNNTLQAVVLGAPTTTRYFISIIEFNIVP